MTAPTAVATDIDVTEFDLWDDAVLRDPHTAFTALRERASAVHLPVNDVWAVTRYDAIRSVLSDPSTFSSTGVAFNDDMNQALRGTTLASDPPEHKALRAALMENLTPRALRGLKEGIERKADDLVVGLVERGSFDGVQDLARELPLQVVLDLIGLEGDVREKILDWGEAAFNVLGPMNERTRESFPLAGELFEWTHGIRPEQLTEGSMGRAIFAAAERGEIPYENCGRIIHQYVAAGMDTTIASIANAIHLLGAHPEQYAGLRADPTRIPAAFAEVLRYEALLHAQGRRVMRDTEIDGTAVPEGAEVAVLLYAGNRDPRRYEDPDAFRIARNPVDHLSFGHGVHTCAGQNLARMEAYAVFEALIRRIESFEVGEPTRKVNNTSRGLSALPVSGVVGA